MPHFTITAKVTVDLEMTVEADTADDARKLLDHHLIMTASLVDVPSDSFDVSEDSISDVTSVRIRREAA